MVKVVDEIGTKYIHSFYNPKLIELFKAHPNEEIDFADARLTFDCMRSVRLYLSMPGYHFCDTLDPVRDAKFKRYAECQERQRKLKEIGVYKLPIPRTLEDIRKFVTLEYTTPYTLGDANNKTAMLWAIILQAKRPDIELVTTSFLDKMFITIHRYYPPYQYAGRPCYYLDGNALYINDNPDREFCASNLCCPAEFGQRVLFSDHNWIEPLKRITLDFQNILKPSTHHIMDYL